MSIWRQKWKEYCNYTGRCLTKQRSKLLSIWDRSFLGLRANGRKIVDQQLPTLLDVTCCVRLHTPLLFVAQSLKPVKLFSQKLPTFLLFRDLRIVAQQCWIRLHSRLPTLLGPGTHITHGLQRLMGCILPTIHCRSQHGWELLRPFARSLRHQALCIINNCWMRFLWYPE